MTGARVVAHTQPGDVVAGVARAAGAAHAAHQAAADVGVQGLPFDLEERARLGGAEPRRLIVESTLINVGHDRTLAA